MMDKYLKCREHDPANIVIILGASDPEMAAIKDELPRHFGWLPFFQAYQNNKPVHAGNAGKFTSIAPPLDYDHELCQKNATLVILIECRPASVEVLEQAFPSMTEVVIIDHHAPGDYGFGRPPAEYWEASSIGQAWTLLGAAFGPKPPPQHLRMVAAADHCLLAAYRGECPGVDPEKLKIWRMESRARFQRRSFGAIQLDVMLAEEKIKRAPIVNIGGHEIRDCRGPIIPELPEAACQMGTPVLAGPLATPDGRQKVVLQAAGPDVIRAFLDGEGPNEIIDRYGDHARGFAGGYLKEV